MLGAALAACAPTPPMSVLLLVVDTLRADALSCYGGPARTPRICSLAERGVLFERAWSNGAWTLPSSVALLTGQYPSVFAREGQALRHKNDFYFVPPEEVLLAEELRERGYQTPAFVENGIARKPRGLQGFELRDVSDWETLIREHGAWGQALGVDLADYRYLRILPALRFLREEARAPFFALEWIMDPHAVYEPPARFLSRVEVDATRLPQPLEYYTRLAAREHEGNQWLDFNRLAPAMSEYEIETVRALYHAELESVDERVGHLLDALAARGLEERTFVVFTSDHGEGFGEHGKYFHADKWFYQEFVQVPLIVAGPGVPAGGRVARGVSHVDLVPTLRELLGLPAAEREQGRSFAALLRGGEDAAPERVQYLVGTSRGEGFAALVDGAWKLIERPEGVELYDLRADPGERRDLAGGEPQRVARMRERVAALRAENLARQAQQRQRGDRESLERVGAETEEELRALGYVE